MTKTSARPRAAVIGGGIFGTTTALELAQTCDVTLFEQNGELLKGATYANHNRHHYGYHYPRSLETARQCLDSRESFEAVYGSALVKNFDNFYCVAATDTKTSPEGYLAFCQEAGLPFEKAWPADDILDRSKIALSLKVPEYVYDFESLKRITEDLLAKEPRIQVRMRHHVLEGKIGAGGLKLITFSHADKTGTESFDFVVNATYVNYNRFCNWFGFKKRDFQFNLQELDIIELPGDPRVGITVQDGPFPSFLPLGRSNRYLMAHVNASQLIRENSAGTSTLLSRISNLESNWENVQAACAEYVPILKRARYIRSIFVDRVVDATRSADDARLTDVTAHGQGCWSIFAAKVITCIPAARKVRVMVEAEL